MIGGGGTTNRISKTYLEYCTVLYDANNPYYDNGLHLSNIAFKYTNCPFNDIWVNFKWKFISFNNPKGATDDFHIFISLQEICRDYIIDGQNHPNGVDIPPFRRNNAYITSSLSVNRSEGINASYLYTTNQVFDYHNYSAHIVDNNFTFYIDGDLIGSINGTNLKMFCIGYGAGGNAAYNCKFFESSLQSITLTDKMSLDVPRPPYILDEKDDNVYGIQK